MSGKDEDAAAGQSAGPPAHAGAAAVLFHRDRRIPLHGRALRLILWVASRQDRINDPALIAGQVWMTWKGDSPNAIDGIIKAPL